jgi:hypothetical protein
MEKKSLPKAKDESQEEIYNYLDEINLKHVEPEDKEHLYFTNKK